MEIRNGDYTQAPGRVEALTAIFMSVVSRWMMIGVALTAMIAYFMASEPEIVLNLIKTPILFYSIIIAEVGLVIYLSARIRKMSVMSAIVPFLAYASLNGVTLSIFSLIYTGASIQNAFIAAACSFAGLSFFGYVTKRDLGPVGTFCHMGLWGIVIYSLLSLIFPSLRGGTMELVYSMVGIVVFSGLTAYDTQKIKSYATLNGEGSDSATKMAIMGALALYLDFINLFLFLLRFLGKRK